MANTAICLSTTINQIHSADQLSALDDAALLARFDNDPARIYSFLLGFNLAFNAMRIAEIADSIEARLIVCSNKLLAGGKP